VGKAPDFVGKYARRVVEGHEPASQLHRAACARHLADLDTGAERGLDFDRAAAAWSIDFFRHLEHSKGQWAGHPFALEPWQQFIVGSLFGWTREDGTRRFRTAYIEVPRKNGKSTLAAGIGLRLAFFDREPGADVYCAATHRAQAKIVFGETQRMVRQHAGLRRRIGVRVGSLYALDGGGSKLEPLGADSDALDGLNIHGALVDELHAHKTRGMLDVLDTATGARRQPLIFYITTAGFDRHSVCWEQHAYSAAVLDGLPDDTLFAFFANADTGDAWDDPATWRKANPNLGVSVMLDDLERKAARAAEMPGALNAFRRLHLCEWTEVAERWLDMTVWDAGATPPVDRAALRGRSCVAGLDLGSTDDASALVLLFPDNDGSVAVLPFFWIPEEGLRQRVRRDRVPYDRWAELGLLDMTPGNVTDYARIHARVLALAEEFDVREIAFDPWHATQLATELAGAGAPMVAFRQGFASMAAPTREFERLVLDRKLRHGGHPILRWHATNVSVAQDAAGNRKPDKGRSREKIDGIVAAVMALGRLGAADASRSAYGDHRLMVV
jgi:phage terminase large subunit-like protein